MPTVKKKLRVTLHPAQVAYLDSQAPFRALIGGRGSGKTFCGAYDIIRRAKPRRLYLAAAPTYPMLRDATLRTFAKLAKELRCLADFRKTDLRALLRNGAEVIFRSADEPDRLRGPNLSGAWLDEASQMNEEAYTIVIACLREEGELGFLGSTMTPRGRAHWTYQVFGQGRRDTALIRAKTVENPFLPSEFYETIKSQYTTLQASQELEGEFVEGGGSIFRRHWFEIVDALPTGLVKARAWDFAATEPAKGKDPDWTAGCLMGRSASGTYHIEDMRRVRTTPLAVEQLVRQTAETDGRDVPIWLEQEPGASGVYLVERFIRQILAGWTVRADKPTGDKVARASPLASQAEAGNVKLLRGSWNKDFLDEIEIFPNGDYDDQVDAASLDFNKLTQPKRRLNVFV